MLLKFKADHISITEFNSIVIDDLTILTGINGSGKTHLLDALRKGKVELEEYDKSEMVYYNYNDFTVITNEQTYKFKTDEWKSITNAYLQRINHFKNGASSQSRKVKSKSPTDNLIYSYVQSTNYDFDIQFGQQKDYALLERIKKHNKIDAAILGAYQPEFSNTFFNFLTNYIRHANGNIEDINIHLLKPRFDKLSKEFEEDLKSENGNFYDFLKNSIEHRSISSINNTDFESPNLFLMDIENEEKKYQLLKHQNIVNKIRHTDYGDNVEFLESEEFIVQHGISPIEQINEVLKEYDCNGYFLSTLGNHEYLGKNDGNIRIYIRLKHYNDNYDTSFDQLSSGEKTLIALSLLIYKSRKKKIIPRILLLDEIDSALHPSMIIRLLNVIQELFIKKHKLKVILATHSPTTVALAEEKSIFVVNRNGKNRIEKQSKNEALKILTEGFITLEEGLQILDQVARKEVTIFTEGNNIEFIKLAISNFSPELVTKIDIVDTLKDRTGKNQLSTLYEFFLKMPHRNKVLFVYDCDVTSKFQENETTSYYTFEQNTENKKVTKGIENLFDEILFTNEFYSVKSKEDGGIHSSLDKNKFLKFITERNKKDDFKNFKGLINKISSL